MTLRSAIVDRPSDVPADGGGSNRSRSRLWKIALQQLADETGPEIAACHSPPGTSTGNALEHRMVSHITQNWWGRPLISHETMVNLMAHTTTAGGLTIQCQLDPEEYPDFHGEWNSVIRPSNVFQVHSVRAQS